MMSPKRKQNKHRSVVGMAFVLMTWLSLDMNTVLAKPWLFNLKDVQALHREGGVEKIAYGPAEQEYGILRLPEGQGPFPVIEIVHGGCWVKSIASSDHTEVIAEALRQEGYATWNIEYRAVDEVGGGYPGTFLDVAQATDYLRKLAPKYNLDLKKFLVLGHSAGGHLALWLSERGRLLKNSALYTEQPLEPKGVISVGGVPDLERARLPAAKLCGRDVVGALTGKKLNRVLNIERFQEISPAAMKATPIPQILLSGDQDQVVPTALAEHYVRGAQKKSMNVRLVKIPYAGHQEYIVPNSVVWPFLLDALKKLSV